MIELPRIYSEERLEIDKILCFMKYRSIKQHSVCRSPSRLNRKNGGRRVVEDGDCGIRHRSNDLQGNAVITSEGSFKYI